MAGLDEVLEFPDGIDTMIELVSPTICASAAKYFVDTLYSSFSMENGILTDSNTIRRYLSTPKKLALLYSAVAWFSMTTLALGQKETIFLTLQRYHQEVFRLMTLIGELRFEFFNNDRVVTDRRDQEIQLDSFLMGISSTNPMYVRTDLSGINISLYTTKSIKGYEFETKISFLGTGDSYLWLSKNKALKDNLERDYSKEIARTNTKFKAIKFLREMKLNMLLRETSKKLYLGTDQIDVNLGYDQSHKLFGNFTIDYEFRFAEAFSRYDSFNEYKLSLTVIDTRRSYAGYETVPGDKGLPSLQRCKFAPRSGGTGYTTFYNEAFNPNLVCPGPYEDKFFSDLEKLLNDESVDPIEIIKSLHGKGIFVDISIEPVRENFNPVGDQFQLLKSQLSLTRDAWVNLSTAVLCYAEQTGDFANYFELIDRKPEILRPGLPTDVSLLAYISGEYLDDLLLLWINRRASEAEGSRPPYFGLESDCELASPKRSGFLGAEADKPKLWFIFDDLMKIRPNRVEFDQDVLARMYANFSVPAVRPILFETILPKTRDALDYLDEFYLRIAVSGGRFSALGGGS